MYYTNCAPQVAQVNRGIWKSLENYIRKLGKEHDIEIWTGCIYKNSKEKLGKLQVPTFFWKIIKYDNIIECYKIPNIILNDKDFKKYKVNLLELKYIINDTKI
jgi:DNA/RNA endonuclease G (NUC1)